MIFEEKYISHSINYQVLLPDFEKMCKVQKKIPVKFYSSIL